LVNNYNTFKSDKELRGTLGSYINE